MYAFIFSFWGRLRHRKAMSVRFVGAKLRWFLGNYCVICAICLFSHCGKEYIDILVKNYQSIMRLLQTQREAPSTILPHHPPVVFSQVPVCAWVTSRSDVPTLLVFRILQWRIKRTHRTCVRTFISLAFCAMALRYPLLTLWD